MWTEQQLAYMQVLGLKLWQPADAPDVPQGQIVSDAVSEAVPGIMLGAMSGTEHSAQSPLHQSQDAQQPQQPNSTPSADIASAAADLEQLLDGGLMAKAQSTATEPTSPTQQTSATEKDNVTPQSSASSKDTGAAETAEKTTQTATIAFYTFSLGRTALLCETAWDAITMPADQQTLVQALLMGVTQLSEAPATQETLSQIQMNHFRWPPSRQGLLADTPCQSAVATYLEGVNCDTILVFGETLSALLGDSSGTHKAHVSPYTLAQLLTDAALKKALWQLLQSLL